jgi:AbiV family abortive infection protein
MTHLCFTQLHDGFSKSISNGMRLWKSGLKLIDEYPDVALGLFELGQEEIGKSFSLLAAFSFDKDISNWKIFWSEWKNHNIKVHRAFFYEHISPYRIEIDDGEHHKLSGFSLREKIFHEKEYSFYVNFDQKKKVFLLPEENVKTIECFNRAVTLSYMSITSSSVQIALDEGDKEVNYRLFSKIAFRILTEEIYQQDMPKIFNEFSKQSSTHASIINNLSKALDRGKKGLSDAIRRDRIA